MIIIIMRTDMFRNELLPLDSIRTLSGCLHRAPTRRGSRGTRPLSSLREKGGGTGRSYSTVIFGV